MPAPPPLIAAFADVAEALAWSPPPDSICRVAVLARAAARPDARARLREAGLECVTTLDGGGVGDAARLAAVLAAAQGWRLAAGRESARGDQVGGRESPGTGALRVSAEPAATPGGEPPDISAPDAGVAHAERGGVRGAAACDADGPGRTSTGIEDADVIGWYEVRISHAGVVVTTDRPITRLHGSSRLIASFNLLGQGGLNAACADLLRRRLADEAVLPGGAFDTMVCAESKAVGLVQALGERLGLDRYVVLRKGVKNYMPRRPRAPLVQEATSITTAGIQALVLDPNDWPLVEGRRVLLVDDVIATGGTARAACALLGRAGADVVAVAAVLLKGRAPDVPRLIHLARPLL